mgnify:FL=1
MGKSKKVRDERISDLLKLFYSESTHICSDNSEAVSLARSVLKYFLKHYPYYITIFKAT